MLPAVSILDAMDDPALFRAHFRDREAWTAWRAFLAALFGLPMDTAMLETYRACTGRQEPPREPAKEAWPVIGRRGGKSRILALIAVYLAVFRDYSPYLAPGEKGFVTVIAADRRQARSIMNYVRGFLTETALLVPLVARDNTEDIELTNRIVIEVATCSFRTVRGRTIVASLNDEVAFWADDSSANPDVEVLAAIRPAMATIPGALLLAASSPYARRGALWDAYRRHYGKDGPVLVWRASTRTMNPTVPDDVIADAYERDPASAAAEYGAEFRQDVETFLTREVVDAAITPGVHELPPVAGITTYTAFVDPSGGSADSMTLAIAHRQDGRAVLDLVREIRPPFSPDAVVEEFAQVLAGYGLRAVTGDRYGGEWPRERFRVHGIDYLPAEKPKSDLYRELLPILNSGQADLLDLPRLISQLCALERRTARGGRDSIDHPPGGHDDVANAVAGALVATGGRDAMAIWIRLALAD